MNKLARMLKKVPGILKREGWGGVFRRVLQKLHVVTTKADPLTLYSFIMDRKKIALNKEAYNKHKNDQVKVLNWVIPEMGEGSGGHTTIFRFISNLEKRGFHSRVYLFRADRFFDNKTLRKFTATSFPILDSKVELYYDVKYMKFLKFMLIFIPISIIGKFMHFSSAVMFILAALSIILETGVTPSIALIVVWQ